MHDHLIQPKNNWQCGLKQEKLKIGLLFTVFCDFLLLIVTNICAFFGFDQKIMMFLSSSQGVNNDVFEQLSARRVQ